MSDFTRDGLPDGLTVTLWLLNADWGTLRAFVRIADAMKVPDAAEIGVAFDHLDDLAGITLGPGDGVKS